MESIFQKVDEFEEERNPNLKVVREEFERTSDSSAALLLTFKRLKALDLEKKR